MLGQIGQLTGTYGADIVSMQVLTRMKGRALDDLHLSVPDRQRVGAIGEALAGAGFEVVNLGVNNDAQKFIDAIREHQPEIIGMSALLTTTMPYMKVVIQALKDENLRDKLFVMVGGAPVTESFAQQVGADAYGRDAATAVDLAKAYMARRRERAASPA